MSLWYFTRDFYLLCFPFFLQRVSSFTKILFPAAWCTPKFSLIKIYNTEFTLGKYWSKNLLLFSKIHTKPSLLIFHECERLAIQQGSFAFAFLMNISRVFSPSITLIRLLSLGIWASYELGWYRHPPILWTWLELCSDCAQRAFWGLGNVEKHLFPFLTHFGPDPFWSVFDWKLQFSSFRRLEGLLRMGEAAHTAFPSLKRPSRCNWSTAPAGFGWSGPAEPAGSESVIR